MSERDVRADMPYDELRLGGMVLRRSKGRDVDIEVPGTYPIRIQAADVPDVLAWLQEEGHGAEEAQHFVCSACGCSYGSTMAAAMCCNAASLEPLDGTSDQGERS